MYFYKYTEDGALESQLFPKENCPENVVEITEEEYIAELEKMNAEAAPPSEPEPEPDQEPTPLSHTTEERVAALESENKTLKAQVSAQSEQMDFYEECIAEMASVVYA